MNGTVTDRPCLKCGAPLKTDDKRFTYCSVTCRRAVAVTRVRAWRATYPEKVAESGRRSKQRRKAHLIAWKYGITENRYWQMLALQENKCAACRDQFDFDKPNSIHVDHDHACCPQKPSAGNPICGNCVRAILCRNCNTALGLLKDSPSRVRSLYEYIAA